MKVFALAAALLMAVGTHTAFAGVTPNTAASAAARSGAKIAPVKSDTQSETNGSSAGQSDTAK